MATVQTHGAHVRPRSAVTVMNSFNSHMVFGAIHKRFSKPDRPTLVITEKYYKGPATIQEFQISSTFLSHFQKHQLILSNLKVCIVQ